MEKDEKRIEELVKKLMQSDRLEKTPANFTDEVMAKIEALPKPKPIVYKPLIPKYVWWLMACGFVGLIVNIYWNKPTNDTSLAERYNLPEFSFNILENMSFNFSETMMYAFVLLAVMIAVQIPLLKQYFNQRLSF